MTALGDIVRALDAPRAWPPLEWCVAHAPDGDLAAALGRAWDACGESADWFAAAWRTGQHGGCVLALADVIEGVLQRTATALDADGARGTARVLDAVRRAARTPDQSVDWTGCRIRAESEGDIFRALHNAALTLGMAQDSLPFRFAMRTPGGRATYQKAWEVFSSALRATRNATRCHLPVPVGEAMRQELTATAIRTHLRAPTLDEWMAARP